jgi:hypothetical protein
MPAFEGLFPPTIDGLVQDLLFIFSTWHGLAKLQMHTEDTLDCLDEVTHTFGIYIHHLSTQTTHYETFEIPCETAAHYHCQAKQQASSLSIPKMPVTTGKRIKQLNLSTYKFHAIGDYTETIRKYGTVDSYSTQIVSY